MSSLRSGLNYEPQSDSAKFARVGGIIGAFGGVIIAAEEAMSLSIDTIFHLPHGENVTGIIAGVGIMAVSGAVALVAPRRIDNSLNEPHE